MGEVVGDVVVEDEGVTDEREWAGGSGCSGGGGGGGADSVEDVDIRSELEDWKDMFDVTEGSIEDMYVEDEVLLVFEGVIVCSGDGGEVQQRRKDRTDRGMIRNTKTTNDERCSEDGCDGN